MVPTFDRIENTDAVGTASSSSWFRIPETSGAGPRYHTSRFSNCTSRTTSIRAAGYVAA